MGIIHGAPWLRPRASHLRGSSHPVQRPPRAAALLPPGSRGDGAASIQRRAAITPLFHAAGTAPRVGLVTA